MSSWWKVAFGIGLLAGMAAADDAPAPKSEKEKQSYAVGVNLGKQLRKQANDLDPALVSQGVKDGLSGGKTLLTDAEITAAMASAKEELRSRQAAAQAESLAKMEKQGEAFLADNKTKEGVVALESGLQYKILKAGNGKKPTAGDTVVCNYRGTLIDGTEFANTYKSKRTATFPVKGALPGWNEALQLMPAGSKWQLFVPAPLAYGKDAGTPQTGPGGALIFELELISIKGTAQPKAAASKGAGPAKSDPSGKPPQAAQNAEPAAAALSGIQVSFKLDSKLSGPTYGGEKWVSPATYTALGDASGVTVETKAEGVSPKTSVKIRPTWVPSDPEMVTVMPGEGSKVTITVKRAGTSSVRVTSGELSRNLSLKAELRNSLLQVEITTGPLPTNPRSDAPPAEAKL